MILATIFFDYLKQPKIIRLLIDFEFWPNFNLHLTMR